MSLDTSDAAETQDSGNEMAGDLESIKASFTQLRQDIMDLLSHAFGLGKTAAHVANDNAGEAVEHLKERIDELKERGNEGVSAIEQKIGENPLPAALIAFGVGFLAAKFLSRR